MKYATGYISSFLLHRGFYNLAIINIKYTICYYYFYIVANEMLMTIYI